MIGFDRSLLRASGGPEPGFTLRCECAAASDARSRQWVWDGLPLQGPRSKVPSLAAMGGSGAHCKRPSNL